jgi:hypothetical protein
MFLLRSFSAYTRAAGLTNRIFSRTLITTMASNRDPNTLSNYNEIRTTKVSINFDIDFTKKRLAGNVILKMKSLSEGGCNEVVLDTR